MRGVDSCQLEEGEGMKEKIGDRRLELRFELGPQCFFPIETDV